MILSADPSTFRSWWRRSKYPPYGLRKVEAISGGKIVQPEHLDRYREEILGIYVNDPLGRSEIGQAISRIVQGDPPYVKSFKKFESRIRELRDRNSLKVVVGGPGAWQLQDRDWIDSLLIGEAEESLEEAVKGKGVIHGRRAEHFVAIRAPSGLAEVEVNRGSRRIPENVILEEMRIQSSAHGRVNLITSDILSYGDESEVTDLLIKARKFGEVTFSNIGSVTAMNFDLEKIRTALNLNENHWISPVLNSVQGSCLYSLDSEVLKLLNRNYIYPMVYVEEERTREFLQYKAVVIPLPQTENYYKVLYEAWKHDRVIVKLPFSFVVDYVLKKAVETRGKNLRELRSSSLIKYIFMAGFYNLFQFVK
ncbi:hypothetical protein L3N51_01902 [Metallosphaera sp. J1]|uniref:hypothetical protein n=1 Tax=Metallosphaera javensis (ex Hofmann et al. 2022) TaxID=99938 RepID=UPI001EE13E17|nr:hypothetical protein [Metallosphaera javensis (ex Hofmann et al. 2022)]MCG3109607.1 hypothetical protein [Metallosphaera javensis (ex Hofmann et al. 2022)]